MRAVVITKPGGPQVLKIQEVKTPEPSEGQVLVAVKAAGVNRVDILQRMGLYPAPSGDPQDIPGVEFAGEVESLGQGVSNFKPGDRVFGIVGGGAYAECLVTPAQMLAKMPEGMSYTDAAAVPEAFITAYDGMVMQAGLSAGETVLINAVGSGVGCAAVQLARALEAVPIGTARSAGKLEVVKKLGLETGIVANHGKFADEVLKVTEGKGPDVILELVGGDYLKQDIACIASCGHIVLVGLLAGSRAEIDLAMVLRKRIVIYGTVLRSRSLLEKIEVMQTFSREVLPLFASGKTHATVDRVFPFAEVAKAHQYVADNENIGKVVLEW